jgi:hypothetical protein
MATGQRVDKLGAFKDVWQSWTAGQLPAIQVAKSILALHRSRSVNSFWGMGNLYENQYRILIMVNQIVRPSP